MIELVELRQSHAKHWLTGHDENGDALVTARKTLVPIHYERDGEWVDIKPEWTAGVLSGVPYTASLYGVGCSEMRLLDQDGPHTVEGHRVWWRGIVPQTDAVLIASATRLQLHLILHGPRAPRSFRFATDNTLKVGGRDNIDRLVERVGHEQHYELDVTHASEGNVVTKAWSGRVKAVDPSTRKKSWSDDVIYPVRII